MTFKELVRQNTGTHFLDSGFENGRHWQQPLGGGFITDVRAEEWTAHDGTVHCEVSASISLYRHLDACLEIDERLTRILGKLQAKHDDGYMPTTAASLLSDKLGIPVAVDGDNACNWENDLTQVFCFAVLSRSSDWYYDSDAIVCIATHNGADVRGGYSDVVVCRPSTSYDGLSNLLDVVVGWRFGSGTDSSGTELDRQALDRLDEHFGVGYHSSPTYHLNESIADVIGHDAESVTVRLKSGETVRAYPHARSEYV